MFIILAISFILPVQGLAEDLKIGYVDINEIYSVHPETEKTNEIIQEKINNLQKEFQEKAAGLSEENQGELANLEEQFQQQVTQIQNEESMKLMKKIEPDLDDIRENLGLDLLLNSNIILSGAEKHNVTEEVIEYFENL